MQIGADTDWARIAAGYGASLALKTDGSLWGWGANLYGVNRDGTEGGGSVPIRLEGEWKDFALGFYVAFAIRADGSLWAWGENSFGQLGQGDVVIRSSPFAVP